MQHHIFFALLAALAHGAIAAQAATATDPPAVAAAPAPALAPFHLQPETAAEVSNIEGYLRPWRQQLAQLPAAAPARVTQDQLLSAAPAPTRFALAFTEAKVPDCLHAEGLKRQPPHIGPFVFIGVLALPFVALAKVRGKCI